MDTMTQYDQKRRSAPHAYSMTPPDLALVEFIANYHGCSKSEAIRNSVRYYAVAVAELKTQTEPKTV